MVALFGSAFDLDMRDLLDIIKEKQDHQPIVRVPANKLAHSLLWRTALETLWIRRLLVLSILIGMITTNIQ